MKAFNKKIPSYNDVLVFTDSLSIFYLSVLTVLAATFQFSIGLDYYLSVVLSILVFVQAAIVIRFYRLEGLFISLAAIIFLLKDIKLVFFTVSIMMLVYLIDRITSRSSQDISVFVLAVLSHLGDAITTYIGLNRGLTEMNPLVRFLVEDVGYWAIFPVKFSAVLLIFYAYIKLETLQKRVFLKAALVLGLYLTVRNGFLISYGA